MIRIDSVHKQFGSTVALDGLSLDVRPGEIFGLLGPNGAGKSTTMALLTGLQAPDAGSVSVVGGDPRDASLRARIGLAPQSLALYEHLSGRENLEFFARMFGLRGERLKQRVDAVLDVVQLSDRQRDHAGGYSGGMQRRLNVAAAIVHDAQGRGLAQFTARHWHGRHGAGPAGPRGCASHRSRRSVVRCSRRLPISISRSTKSSPTSKAYDHDHRSS